jgi:hypothetical protein
MVGVAVCVEDGKVDVHGIEHQFGTDKQRNEVTSCEETEDANEEQHR